VNPTVAIRKSPTGDWPSSDATLTMLVNAGAMPAVTASASILQGGESVFARIELDDMPKDRARHAAHFSLIGPRDTVLAVLRELRAAVDAAQVEPPEQ
jgi:hypothetical protein